MKIVSSMKAKIGLLAICLMASLTMYAQWPQGKGIYGAQITSFAVNGTYTFASTYGGGVFLSADNGANWTPVNNGLLEPNVNALAFAGNNLFAGTWNNYVYRSTDMGASWTMVSVGLTQTTFTSLTSIASTIYAASFAGGVFRSDNNGAIWTEVNSGLTSLQTNSLVNYGGNLFLGTVGGGVFISTNGGTSWTAANTGIPNIDIRDLAADENNLYAANSDKVYVWKNSSSSWTSISIGLPTGSSIERIGISNGTLFVYFYAKKGIYFSSNQGASWSHAGNEIPNLYVTAIGPSGANTLVGTEGGGVYLSADNGATWSASNSGMTDAPIQTIVEKGDYLFSGTAGSGVYRSGDGGANWTSVNSGIDHYQISSLIVKGTHLFAGTGVGHSLVSTEVATVYKSDDDGASWTEVNNGLPNSFGQSISSLAIIDSDLFAGTRGSGVYRTSDDGSTWTSAGLSSYEVTALAVVNTALFASTNTAGLFMSTDKGANWVSVATGLPEVAIASLLADGSNLYIGTYSKGVFLTNDHGSTLTPITPPITNYTIISMGIKNGYFAILIQYGGLYISTDNGASWCKQTDNYLFEGVGAINLTNNGSFVLGTQNGLYVHTPLVPPQAKQATGITASGFTANWKKTPGASSYILSYSSDNFSTKTKLNITDTTKTISGLNANVQYQYTIAAMEGCLLASTYSDTVTLHTLLNAPIAKAATNIVLDGFTIGWTKVKDAVSYQLDVSTDNFSTYLTGYESKSIADTVISITGLVSGTQYKYRVRAVNSFGTPSLNSNIIYALTIPDAPIADEVTTSNSSGFLASWSNVRGATGYLVDVSQDNFSFFVAGYNSLAVTSNTLEVHLAMGGPFQFRVRATNASGASDYSNTVSLIIAGVNETHQDISLYPNPSHDYIFIKGVDEPVTNYSVKNSFGLEIPITLEREGALLKSMIHNLKHGLHILEIQTENDTVRLKFIKD